MDGDTPGDVLAGLKLAIKGMDWNPQGLKYLILIGDAGAISKATRRIQPRRRSRAFLHWPNLPGSTC